MCVIKRTTTKSEIKSKKKRPVGTLKFVEPFDEIMLDVCYKCICKHTQDAHTRASSTRMNLNNDDDRRTSQKTL